MFAVVNTIGRMPLSWRYGIARFGADRIYNWGPNIGKNVRSNMRHVLGPDASDEEVDRIARQCARNTGRYYADVDRHAPHGHQEVLGRGHDHRWAASTSKRRALRAAA